ncbi:MAG: hypothetical protein ACMVY4_01725 [Minwuia sp.]|uniref:hypothetical protein n=1 Tax=Minwuia sp. TaxID=2493630 RepID=UPI003A88EB22
MLFQLLHLTYGKDIFGSVHFDVRQTLRKIIHQKVKESDAKYQASDKFFQILFQSDRPSFFILSFFIFWLFSFILSFVINTGQNDTLLRNVHQLTLGTSIEIYILATQAVLIGIIFPIAVSLTTSTIRQNTGGVGRSPEIKIYHIESHSFSLGASSLALCGVNVLWISVYILLSDRSPLVSHCRLASIFTLSTWLLINIFGLWKFFSTSLRFLDADERMRIRKAYTMNKGMIENLLPYWKSLEYQGQSNRLSQILNNRFPGNNINILFGHNLGQPGNVEILKQFPTSGYELHDVWATPLKIVICGWIKRSIDNSGAGAPKTISLEFPASFESKHKKEFVLCQRTGGGSFSLFERLIISRCFRFRKTRL